MHNVDPEVPVPEEVAGLVAENFAGTGAEVDDLLPGQLDRPKHVGQGIDDAREAPPYELELLLNLAPLETLSGFRKCPLDRRRKPDEIALEHIVGRAVLKRANGIFLADRSRHEYEWNIGGCLARDG